MERGRKGRYKEKNFKHHRHTKDLIANGSLRKGKKDYHLLLFRLLFSSIHYSRSLKVSSFYLWTIFFFKLSDNIPTL